MEKETSTPPIMENVLFTKLSIELFGKAKASEGLKILDVVASEFGLNIKSNSQYKTSYKALINQIKNN
jgi:hypothetical protein